MVTVNCLCPSQACLTVVQYMSENIKHVRVSLDGTNRELVMSELGCRFHRVIYEHLQQFQYNSTGELSVTYYSGRASLADFMIRVAKENTFWIMVNQQKSCL